MDFFDTALDKAKEAIEIVSKKTEEVVTTQKQRFNIASLENQCSKLYKSLGEIYYERLADTYIEGDDEVRDLVELITKKLEEIESLKAKLDSEK